MRISELSAVKAEIPRQTRSTKGRFGGTSRPSVKLTVTHRQQSPQEARAFATAYDLLVAAIVRRELDRAKETT